jgi:lysophospholipase L1-like esterase
MTTKRALFLSLLAFLGLLLPSHAQITIMPVGDSGTLGVDSYTLTSGGYRDPLYHDLTASSIAFTFVGANNDSATPDLTAAAQTFHNGYGHYRINDILDNLDGNVQPVASDGNRGGYWLTGGHGTGRAAVSPDLVLLEIGANDLLQHTDPQNPTPTDAQFLTDLEDRLHHLITTFHDLSPHTVFLVAGIYPFKNSPQFNTQIAAYNAYIKNTLVPSLPYTHFVDNYACFANADGSVIDPLIGSDNVHPTRYGYPLMAENWAEAIRAIEGSKPKLDDLTVTNGTGSGSYPAGTIVTVNSAPPPTGKQFAQWSPATTALSNPFWPIATFVVPAAATSLIATYAPTGSPLIPDGTYNIVALWDGLSLAAAGTTSGSLAQQQTYIGAANQKWVLKNLGNHTVELSLPGTTSALSVVGNSKAAGANLDVETYTGASNQNWIITPILGTTELVNANSGMAINILGYQKQPGVQLVQQTAGYVANQVWALYPVTP